MLTLGLNFSAIPQIIGLNIDRFSLLMTPLILLFIGLSMRLTWAHVKTIFAFLFFRSGIAFAISGLVLYFFPAKDIPTLLLIVVFPQSACSFWPYAHMVSVGDIENKLPGERSERTFDQEFAMNVLACSLPFSVVLIMLVYSLGDFFSTPGPVMSTAVFFLSIAASMVWIAKGFKMPKSISEPEREKALQ